jgi:DNA-binding SARP family transcriptional activator
VRYRLLGSVEVVSADGPVALGGRRQRLLIAALLLDAGRRVPADRLCELLWGPTQPAHPAAALRSQIARLRRTLVAVGGEVRLDSDGYRLDIGPDELDANRFEDLVAAANQSSGKVAVALLDDALELWHSSAISEFSDHPYVQPAAGRLDELRNAAREQRAELLLGLDRPADAVVALRRLVSEFPERERARGLLMEALYRVGRHTDALNEYRSWRHHLANELGLEPSPALQRLEGDIVRHTLGSRVQRPVREHAPRARVPQPASSFIGRVDDLSQIARRLAPRRLVTVAGPGGVGKTRLALEVLSRDDAHTGAHAFADLSAVVDRELVAAALGDAVDMPAAGGGDPHASLLSFLADRHLLLVLDNCEHVLDAARELVEDLFAGCPNVSLLATSREPLGIDGECVWRLPSLTSEDATALFVERATDGGARLVLERDLPFIGEICGRLDGLPLAVELAAKHAEHLALPRLRDLLEDRFRLLVGGSNRVLPRQRTLEATMMWSYELLDDDEKRLLRQTRCFHRAVHDGRRRVRRRDGGRVDNGAAARCPAPKVAGGV